MTYFSHCLESWFHHNSVLEVGCFCSNLVGPLANDCRIFNPVHFGVFFKTAYQKIDASVKYKGSWSHGVLRKRQAQFLATEKKI